MNEIYLSVFLTNLAESMISIFVPIYLYSLHYSITQILFFFFIAYFGSVVFALPAAKVVAKVGAKHSILFSIPFLIIYYLGLRFLPTQPWLFFILPFCVSFRSLFYNFGFELNFIDHFDKKRVGRELSLVVSASIIGTVLSPLVAGLVIANFGYATIFIIASVILLASSLPLFITTDKCPGAVFTWKDMARLFFRRGNTGMILSFTGYAIESSIGGLVWPIFLIIILGAAQKVGYVASFSAFATVVVVSVIGKLTDRFNPKRLLRLGTMFYFFGWLGSLFADSVFKVFFIDSYRSISGRFLILPWSSIFYKITSRETYFQLVVWRDIIFNASRLVVLPFIMAIFMFAPSPFFIVFLVAAGFTLLYPLINNIKFNDTEVLS